MGIGDLSCYDKQAAPTPQIDRLAKEGIREFMNVKTVWKR